MDAYADWSRTLFETLTSNRASRNKFFSQFANDAFREIHKRYRIVSALKKEAARLNAVPESHCWVSSEGEEPVLHMESPRLFYKRSVGLKPHEWEWLLAQEEIQYLLRCGANETRVLT